MSLYAYGLDKETILDGDSPVKILSLANSSLEGMI